MAENAVTSRIKELKEDLRTATKTTVKKEDDDRIVEDIDKTLKIARALREKLLKRPMKDSGDGHNLGESKFELNETPVVVQSGETSIKDGDEGPKRTSKDQLVDLLITLPRNSATEDTDVMKEILALISQCPDSQEYFGKAIWPTDLLLNEITIERSYSDASLRSELVSIVLLIVRFNEKAGGKIVQECSVDAMSFLISCLNSQIEIKRNAAVVISELANHRSNRKKMGELGFVKPLVKILQEKEGDKEAVTNAGGAIRFLCRGVVENRRIAVNNGAVIAVIEKIKSGFLLEEMLETLEALSEDESAIKELEVMNMLQCLFWILQENVAAVTEKGKEYCMLIIHTMCVYGDVKKINEVENARQTLQSVADSGTKEAKEKAADLLSRLKDIDSN